jgi:hypothetical protein
MSTTTQFASTPSTAQQQQQQQQRQRHIMLLQQQQRQLSRLGTGTQLTPQQQQQQQQMFAQFGGVQQHAMSGVQGVVPNATATAYNPMLNTAPFTNGPTPVASTASIPQSMASNPALQRMPPSAAMAGQPMANRTVPMNTGQIPGQMTTQQAGFVLFKLLDRPLVVVSH